VFFWSIVWESEGERSVEMNGWMVRPNMHGKYIHTPNSRFRATSIFHYVSDVDTIPALSGSQRLLCTGVWAVAVESVCAVWRICGTIGFSCPHQMGGGGRGTLRSCRLELTTPINVSTTFWNSHWHQNTLMRMMKKKFHSKKLLWGLQKCRTVRASSNPTTLLKPHWITYLTTYLTNYRKTMYSP